MKKILSVFLAVLMVVSAVPFATASAAERYPIIYIRGNGEPIYRPDGTRVATEIGDLELGGVDKDTIVDTCVNILTPLLTEGLLFDEWDNYGKAVYDEISPLFPDAGLDENGNPKNGTGASASAIDHCDNKLAHSAWEFNNGYDYGFVFDWRLSPYDLADRLHAFITNIMTATGKSKVNIWGRCLGGGVLMAYLEKYGHLNHINNVMFFQILSNETTVISKAFSGQVEFDANLAEKYISHLDFCGREGVGVGFVLSDVASEIVFKSIDFLNQIGATDKLLGGVEDLYAKLYKALVPALAHAVGLATQLGYWACVSEEDMDAALDLMFGEEGTELRTKYKGIVDKILYYRERVTKKLVNYELLDTYRSNGMHLGFVANYGFMNAPFTKDADLLSDALVSLEHATFGATCAKLGKTLSEDYIAGRVAEGKGRYISPDKQVDLSTAYSPDTTWIVKNAHHNVYEPFNGILYEFLNGEKETIDTMSAAPQFLSYDVDTKTASPMTEENSADLDFIHKSVEEPTKETIFVSAMRFFTMIFKFITKLLRGEISLGAK